MSNGSWVLIAVGGICVGGFAVWQSHQQPEAKPKAATRLVSPPPELSEPTAATVARGHSTAETPLPASPPPLPIASVQPEPPSATTPEQRTFELQQRFEQDLPPDARAYSIGKDVRVALESALGAEGQLRDIECKLKTCRASLGFADIDADKALFKKVLSAGEGPFASFAMRADRQIGADGKVSTILFFYL